MMTNVKFYLADFTMRFYVASNSDCILGEEHY